MKETYNLTKDAITPTLLKLSIPIIATNFIQTAYGLVDMMWVGKLGSGSVAAVGTAIFFVNLAQALFSMILVGSGVKVAQSMGAGKEAQAREYIINGFFMSIILGIFYMILILSTQKELIGFFELGNQEIEQLASQFLIISMIGTIFTFFNMLFSIVLNSMGNSGKPFHINIVGFIINMILDPLFIFGFSSFDGWGVSGAAIATLFANIIVTILFVRQTRSLNIFTRSFSINPSGMKEVLKMGIPITVQRVTFTFISIIIAKIIVQWGADAIAVQRVGIQIESISFMTMAGLQGAIAAFIGQNFGAKQSKRIHEGYNKALFITIIFGVCISFLLILFPKQLFSIFLTEKTSLELGVDYLRIIGFSQVFMCMEIMTVGAFNGIGKTYIPPIFSIIFTAMRIPLAIAFSIPFGLNGVWMAIAISSVFKGIILVLWMKRTLSKIDDSIYTHSIAK